MAKKERFCLRYMYVSVSDMCNNVAHTTNYNMKVHSRVRKHRATNKNASMQH